MWRISWVVIVVILLTAFTMPLFADSIFSMQYASPGGGSVFSSPPVGSALHHGRIGIGSEVWVSDQGIVRTYNFNGRGVTVTDGFGGIETWTRSGGTRHSFGRDW